MRIGQLCDGLNIGGVQKVALNLSSALAADGQTVFHLFRIDGPLRDSLDSRVKAIQYAKGAPKIQALKETWLTAFKLAALFRDLQLDVIHTHDILAWAVGSIVESLSGVPVLRTQHNFIRTYERRNARTLKWLPFERWTRLFHCIFQATGEDLHLAGVKRSKIVVESGVWEASRHLPKAAARAQNGVLGSQRIVITVGRLVGGKGWELVPKITQTVSRSNRGVEFWVVGDGPLRPMLEDAVRELGLQKVVRFFGERSEVDELYSAADVALFRADSHAGMVEATAFVPMVVGNGLCQREYIVHGKTGILCDKSAESYAEALLVLLENNSLRQQYAKDSVRLFQEKFSVDQAVPRLLQQYQRIM